MAQSAPSKPLTAPVRGPPPALNPEQMALVQPWKDFVSRGWITAIKAEFTPTGNSIKVTISESVNGFKGGDQPPGVAKQIIVEAGLWSPRGPGKASSNKDNGTPRPKRSLTKEDFGEAPDVFVKRVEAVASALGADTARGRIGSLGYLRDGCDSFDKWWRLATSSAKTRILTDKKHYDSLDPEDLSKVGKLVLKSPFRGSVPTPAKEEEDAKSTTE